MTFLPPSEQSEKERRAMAKALGLDEGFFEAEGGDEGTDDERTALHT